MPGSASAVGSARDLRSEPAHGRADWRGLGHGGPELGNFPIARVRALRRISGGNALRYKLTTLVAPVGFGKTVLMAMVHGELQRAGKQCVWIGLDDSHASMEAIIDAIALHLQPSEPQVHPTESLLSGASSLDQRTDKLIALVRRSPLPIVVFIDNLNCCVEDGLERFLDRLCFDTSVKLQLVLSSTRDLPFNRGRAELDGLLLPLGADDLCFDRSEVETVLPDHLKQSLGSEGLATIVEKTEGWPAAVRMIQIILERSSDISTSLHSISGSHQMLADLLNREILLRFPPEQQLELRELSLLRSFSMEMCRDLWPAKDVAQLLDELLQRNLLVIPLDSERVWFRFHGLLRDFLIADAQRHVSAARRREVLRNAAEWCERHAQWRDAIEYAIQAEANEYATRMLDLNAERAVRDRGQVAKFLEWFETLDQRGAALAPQTEYWHIWALAFRRQYEAAKRALAKLQRKLAERPADRSILLSRLKRQLSLLQASIDSLTDAAEAARQEALDWLAEVQETDDPFEVSAAHCIVGSAYTAQHRFVEARKALQAAQECAFQAGSVYVNGWVTTYENLLLIAEGHYADAYAGLVSEMNRTRAGLAEHSGVTGALELVAAKCAVEMGLDEEANQLLVAGLPNLRTHGFLEVAACGLSAAMAIWDGMSSGPCSRRALQEIANSYSPRLSLMLGCFVTKRMIELGLVDAAIGEASKIGMNVRGSDPSITEAGLPQMRDIFSVTHAELLLATRNFGSARPIIESGIQLARNQRRMGKLVNWHLLRAHLATQEQQHELAARSLIEAVRIAASRRIKRPFVVRAQHLAVAMEGVRAEPGTFVLDGERAFFTELTESMGIADGPDGATGAGDRFHPLLVESLTPRELDLLRLVAMGMSNDQIGGRLNISTTTVKWHLQNVFGKMNVKSRSAAVAHARLLKLLN